jgi:hypothetical protein
LAVGWASVVFRRIALAVDSPTDACSPVGLSAGGRLAFGPVAVTTSVDAFTPDGSPATFLLPATSSSQDGILAEGTPAAAFLAATSAVDEGEPADVSANGPKAEDRTLADRSTDPGADRAPADVSTAVFVPEADVAATAAEGVASAAELSETVVSVGAGPADAGPEDAGPEDAGPEDAVPEDAGPEDAVPAAEVPRADVPAADFPPVGIFSPAWIAAARASVSRFRAAAVSATQASTADASNTGRSGVGG